MTPCHDRSKATTSKRPVASFAILRAASFDSAPVLSGSTLESESGRIPASAFANPRTVSERKELCR